MSAAVETINLPHLPPHIFVHAALYRNIQNAGFLRQQLIEGNADFEYALIDASMILSRTHALSAVFRAVNDYLNDRLKSRNVHSEIVFSLSPANNIADSFRKFGIADTTKDLLVVKISISANITHETVATHLGHNVEGSAVPFDDDTLYAIADVAKIKKAYKLGGLAPAPTKASDQADGIHSPERQHLEAAVLGAMALRGAL